MAEKVKPKDIWSQQDVELLLDRMAVCSPADVEKLRSQTSESRLDWEIVKFDSYNAVQCKKKWKEICKTVSLTRTMREVIKDTEHLVKLQGNKQFKGKTRRTRAKAIKENTGLLDDLFGSDMVGTDSPSNTAFNLWCQNSRMTLLVENPSMSGYALKKTLSERWTELPRKKKLLWVNKALKIQQNTCAEHNDKLSGGTDVHIKFVKEMFKTLKENQPKLDIPDREMLTIVLKSWKKMTLEAKRKFDPAYKIGKKPVWEGVPEAPPSPKELYMQMKLPSLIRKNKTTAWSIAEEMWEALSDSSKRHYKKKAKAKKLIYENELKKNNSLLQLAMRRKRAPSSYDISTKMAASIVPDCVGKRKIQALTHLWSNVEQKEDYIKAAHIANINKQAKERLSLQMLPHAERLAIETMWEMKRKRKLAPLNKKNKRTKQTENEVDEEHIKDELLV